MMSKISIVIFLCKLLVSVECKYQKQFALEKYLEDGLLPGIAKMVENKPERSLTKCYGDIIEWKNSLTSDIWAAQMLDSGGKFPSGYLMGNFFSLGEFKECVSINKAGSKKSIYGKYCPVTISLSNIVETLLSPEQSLPNIPEPMILQDGNDLGNIGVPLIFGTCVPDSCNVNEIRKLLNEYLISSGFNFTKPLVVLEERLCSTSYMYDDFNGADIAAIIVFSLFALLMVLSTLYDVLALFVLQKKHRFHEALIIFSIYTNTSKLTKINKSGGALRCLHGIRVLSMTWVILGHRFGLNTNFPLENLSYLREMVRTLPAMLIGGASVSVDTFFLLSGFLVAYVFFSHQENKKSFNVGLFYFHRFLRIWPAMAAYVFISATLARKFTSGPMWPINVYSQEATCGKTWWSTLLYVQNYVHPNSMCAPITWYLAIDTQLYILSPILLIPLWKWPKIGKINLLFWFVVSQASIITVVFIHNWAGFMDSDQKYWSQYYMATHTRAAVWLLGFIGGYLMYITKNKTFKINKIVVFIGWLVCLAVQGSIVLGVYPMSQNNYEPTHLRDGSFSAFSRSAWGMCVLWVIFTCSRGYGGPVNWFLSWRIFEVLGKLSYSMYLLHSFIQVLISSPKNLNLHFGYLSGVYDYFGDLVASVLISYVWVLAFESPFMALEKLLFNRDTRHSKVAVK